MYTVDVIITCYWYTKHYRYVVYLNLSITFKVYITKQYSLAIGHLLNISLLCPDKIAFH